MAKFQIRLPEDFEIKEIRFVPDKNYSPKAAAYRLWQYIYRYLPGQVTREFQSMVKERPFLVPYSKEEHEEEKEVERRLRTGL
jgi:hypothetical protein